MSIGSRRLPSHPKNRYNSTWTSPGDPSQGLPRPFHRRFSLGASARGEWPGADVCTKSLHLPPLPCDLILLFGPLRSPSFRPAMLQSRRAQGLSRMAVVEVSWFSSHSLNWPRRWPAWAASSSKPVARGGFIWSVVWFLSSLSSSVGRIGPA